MSVAGYGEAADALELLAKRRNGLEPHDRMFLEEMAKALRLIPGGKTLAIVWNELGFSHVVTDDPGLTVLSIDTSPRASDDRVYMFGDAIKRVTREEMEALIGTGTVGRQGDGKVDEQAIRALLAADPATGKPDLRLVKSDEE